MSVLSHRLWPRPADLSPRSSCVCASACRAVLAGATVWRRNLSTLHKAIGRAALSPDDARGNCLLGQQRSGHNRACKHGRAPRSSEKTPHAMPDEASAKSALGQQKLCHSCP
jgi:hypothetical protein